MALWCTFELTKKIVFFFIIFCEYYYYYYYVYYYLNPLLLVYCCCCVVIQDAYFIIHNKQNGHECVCRRLPGRFRRHHIIISVRHNQSMNTIKVELISPLKWKLTFTYFHETQNRCAFRARTWPTASTRALLTVCARR